MSGATFKTATTHHKIFQIGDTDATLVVKPLEVGDSPRYPVEIFNGDGETVGRLWLFPQYEPDEVFAKDDLGLTEHLSAIHCAHEWVPITVSRGGQLYPMGRQCSLCNRAERSVIGGGYSHWPEMEATS